MVSKQDLLLNHIEQLAPGARISIRSLARELEVSEGTAYKSIKYAEARGLVATRPKVGTVRLEGRGGGGSVLSQLISRLGLSVLAGEEHADSPVSGVVMADGSSEQFARALRAAGDSPLCLIGDRPDILRLAAVSGANIIATGGAQVDGMLLLIAASNGGCVLASTQDALTLINLLNATLSGSSEQPKNMARDWMSMPMYLYHNDVVADWHSVCRPIFSMYSRQPVVNDDLSLCGTVTMDKAMSAPMSQKISNICSTDCGSCVFDESTPMRSIAARLLSENCAQAFITREGKLCGMINPGDLLRYFLFSASDDGGAERFSGAMECIDHSPDSLRRTYLLRLPEGAVGEDGASGLLLPLLLSAVRRHYAAGFGGACSFESGTFYSLDDISLSGELMISSEIKSSRPLSCVIDVEIYDDSSHYARGTFIVSASCGEGDKTI